MTDYVPMYKRPDYIEAHDLGFNHGRTGKSPMDAFYHGGIEAEKADRERLGYLNFAYLSGWFAGSYAREDVRAKGVETAPPTPREMRMAEHRAQEFSKSQGGPAK